MKHIKEFKEYTGKEIMICPNCDGSGYNKKDGSDCKLCKGTGEIKPKKSKKINEDASWLLLAGGTFFLYKFIKSLIKDLKFSRISIDDLQTEKLKLLAKYVNYETERGEKLKFSENIVYYIFEFGDATIKINKNERTLIFKLKDGDFCYPIKITQQQIDDLIETAKEETGNNESLELEEEVWVPALDRTGIFYEPKRVLKSELMKTIGYDRGRSLPYFKTKKECIEWCDAKDQELYQNTDR